MKQKTKLMLGDNIESLKKLPDNSIDSVVTDPPYGLSAPKNSGKTSKGGFMNKKWDYDVPSVEFWKEVYRVLKPGGHIVSFGGTRTYHRMVVNIEDAGFEIRDQIMWLYGSGFPKSHNIGKAVDKLEGNEREVVGREELKERSTKRVENASNVFMPREYDYTKGSSPYEGWGTALKPANEPICVARKPLSEKSVAENVLKWGTGGINVDNCRVGSEGGTMKVDIDKDSDTLFEGGRHNSGKVKELNEGRFPANIILECTCDEVIKGEKGEIKKTTRDRKYDTGEERWTGLSTKKIEATDNYNDKGDIHTNPMCPCRLLDEQSGESKSKKASMKLPKTNSFTGLSEGATDYDKRTERGHNDTGGASRFFYQAKVSKAERNMGLDNFEEKKIEGRDPGQDDRNVAYKTRPSTRANTHPTVKPVSLMTYLCRLITPENGIILDPFMGSGSTGIAAQLEGFRFVGMEMDEEYMKIATARIENYEKYRKFIKFSN